MVGRLIFILLPYALVAACVAGIGYGLLVIVRGAETEPTDVAIATLGKGTPDKEWLHVGDGGLFLPDAVADTTQKKGSSTKNKTNYYVPLVSGADALLRAGGTPSRAPPVYVKFSRAEFEDQYGDIEKPTNLEAFVPIDVKGTRCGSMSFSSKFKEYLRDERHVEPEAVTMIDFNDHPLQRGEAAMMVVGSAIVGAGSLFWLKKRWTPAASTMLT